MISQLRDKKVIFFDVGYTLDAPEKSGVPAEKTVFIDDSVRNLQGAAELGITPILIAANPEADVETDFLKIHDLRELIR